jgi:hypothetical protein
MAKKKLYTQIRTVLLRVPLSTKVEELEKYNGGPPHFGMDGHIKSKIKKSSSGN